MFFNRQWQTFCVKEKYGKIMETKQEKTEKFLLEKLPNRISWSSYYLDSC